MICFPLILLWKASWQYCQATNKWKRSWPICDFTKQLHLSLECPQFSPALLHCPKTVMTQQVSKKPGNPIPKSNYNAVVIALLSLSFSPPHSHQFQFLKHHNYIHYYKLFACTIWPGLYVLSSVKTIHQEEAILLRLTDLQGNLAELELKLMCAVLVAPSMSPAVTQ